MKTILKFWIAPFLIFLFLCTCSKKETLNTDPILGLGGDTWAKGPIDLWIEKEFVDPYNIEVKYKWDPYEFNYLKNLVPPKEEKVQMVMSAVKDIWIKPYEKVIGANFIKKFAPKQFIIGGSAEWNSDGTIVLGQAEGGRKIVLLVVNEFDPKKITEIKRMLHTMHHEFAHILHQNILYPQAWKSFNPEWYTATWYNNMDSDAHRQGLVTAYSKANADEDFVETIATLLVDGQDYFNALVAQSIVPQKSKEILRAKEAMIVEYFEKNYKIDFRQLQRETQAAIQTYLNSQN